ncbi:hydantoinase/oxoprolinase family protein [Lysinibacillus sp. FJAT-14222]|uniref:hydantoinase/oxoprolinase family protein n=1 Tax=Lysinibacillus sp. FJAT-14222 TaxID=1932366 RepID=UPI0006AF0EAA|nr:hydantoinase/oxoprolinase family protein [Lysinibacillus sp. FJAT-14222]KOS63424.1 5-oxoprolinase [Lysinibacillus sp. FJAT-14222]
MKIATDIGGTFTDLVYTDEKGNLHFDKGHTTPGHFEDGILNVLERHVTEDSLVESFIHGSTVIINTLTERKGGIVGLITTKGFRDVLEIARGNRPDLYNFKYKKPTPFVERYLRQEIDERIDFKGNIMKALNIEDVGEIVNKFKELGVEAIAISLIHGYKNPKHEIQLKEEIIKIWPEVYITLSSETIKEYREYERTNTTVLNSYVKPIAHAYLKSLKEKLSTIDITEHLKIMQSNGGTTSFDKAMELPINLVESGPVAGMFGAAKLGELLNESNIIAFDVGGTTAKCSLITNGKVNVTTDYYIERNEKFAGYPIKTPVVDIVEIGNGGGSIARVDQFGSLKVGPDSAGANPGPVAYGLGNTQPTITDANVYLGRLSLENFDNPVSINKIEEALIASIAKPFHVTAEEAAQGILDIANSNMLNALKLISIRKGYDPEDFTMVAFGGGGPLHAINLAEELNMKKVIIPYGSSVFSAIGMMMTEYRQDYIQTNLMNFDKNHVADIQKNIDDAIESAYKDAPLSKDHYHFEIHYDLRYKGQEHAVKMSASNIAINEAELGHLAEAFHIKHKQEFSFDLPNTPIELVNLHLTIYGKDEAVQFKELDFSDIDVTTCIKSKRQLYVKKTGWVKVNVYDQQKLVPGYVISGPAIVENPTSTVVISEKQSIEIDKYGNIIVEMGEK